jgi:hypothetical protein
VALSDDVSRIAAAAALYAAPGEDVAAVIAIEPAPGERLYLIAFTDAEGARSWLAIDDNGVPVTSRNRVRDAASIAALVEVAEESAGMSPSDEPRLASLSYLDSLGTQRGNGDFGAAIQGGLAVVDELAKDIEGHYKIELT